MKVKWYIWWFVMIVLVGLIAIFVLLSCSPQQQKLPVKQLNIDPNSDKAKVDMLTIIKKSELKVAKYDEATAWSKKAAYVMLFGFGIGVALSCIKGIDIIGKPIAIGSLAGLVVCAANNYLPLWFSLICLFAVIVAAGGLLYYFVQKYLIHKTALTEVVQTVDKTKEYLTSQSKDELFGNPMIAGGEDGIIKTEIQSSATTEIVGKIRNNK